MANNITHCIICKKRVQNHEGIASCNLCNHPSHFRCLPIYTDEDNTYATDPNGHWSCPTCLSIIFPFNSIEDDDNIQLEIRNHTNNMHNIETLNEMIFQPFEINDMEEINDLDPDSNFYNPFINQNITGCKYYNFDQLNKETNSNSLNHFSTFCFNIRSLPKNHRKLLTLLDTIDVQFSTLSLTETWLQDHNSELYEIDGFTHVSQIRSNKGGGGVSIFIRNNISFKTREDLNYNSTDYQLLWVELDKLDTGTSTNIITGVIYRRPGQKFYLLTKN